MGNFNVKISNFHSYIKLSLDACSDVPEHEKFEPKVAAVRPYEDSDYQPCYFVAESIFDAMQKLK